MTLHSPRGAGRGAPSRARGETTTAGGCLALPRPLASIHTASARNGRGLQEVGRGLQGVGRDQRLEAEPQERRVRLGAGRWPRGGKARGLVGGAGVVRRR